MGELQSISWKRFEKFLLLYHCTLTRIKGDHRIYQKHGLLRPIVIPHYTPLPPFIIFNNLRILGVSKEKFLESLSKKEF